MRIYRRAPLWAEHAAHSIPPGRRGNHIIARADELTIASVLSLEKRNLPSITLDAAFTYWGTGCGPLAPSVVVVVLVVVDVELLGLLVFSLVWPVL